MHPASAGYHSSHLAVLIHFHKVQRNCSTRGLHFHPIQKKKGAPILINNLHFVPMKRVLKTQERLPSQPLVIPASINPFILYNPHWGKWCLNYRSSVSPKDCTFTANDVLRSQSLPDCHFQRAACLHFGDIHWHTRPALCYIRHCVQGGHWSWTVQSEGKWHPSKYRFRDIFLFTCPKQWIFYKVNCAYLGRP